MTTKKLHWGYLVSALFGGFVIFILACVGFASFQRFDLVDKDYYEKGVAHQQQIDQMERVAALSESPSVVYSAAQRGLQLKFPAAFAPIRVTGTIGLFRPSNAVYDRTAALSLSEDGSQSIDMAGLPPGKWRIKLSWQYNGVGYYQESQVIAE